MLMVLSYNCKKGGCVVGNILTTLLAMSIFAFMTMVHF